MTEWLMYDAHRAPSPQEYKNAADSLINKGYSKYNREATTSLLTSILDNVADGIAASR